jgi:phosphate transport system substrate-binding protein
MRNMIRLISAAVLTLATIGTPALADTVKLAGVTSVVDVLITPNRAVVEKLTGHSLEIMGNVTGKGLVDLAESKVDAAIISESLDAAVAEAAVAGKKIDASRLRVHELRKDEIVFLVNARNPVTRLTPAQLSDIYTGKISNWKQVGGKDLPITVYADALTGETHAMVKKVVMRGSEYTGGVKCLTSAPRIVELVTADESALGALSRGFVKAESKTRVIETVKIERPLAMVTLGEPQPKVMDVINAFRAEASRWSRRTAQLRPSFL